MSGRHLGGNCHNCGRHDFGTRLYNETENLKLVMAVIGQKDVKTAMRSQHPDLEITRAALNVAER